MSNHVPLNEAIQVATQAVLLFTALATLAAFVRYPGRERGTIALMFGALGVTTVVAWIQNLTAFWPPWLETVSTAAIVAHPYLMVRVVALFRRVPIVIEVAALTGMLACEALLVGMYPDSPQWVTSIVIAYVVVVELYAAGALVSGATRSRGVAKRRLMSASLGTALLAILLLYVGAQAFAPWLALPPSVTGVVGFASIGAFYLGFAPPRWLVRSWNDHEVARFAETMARHGGEGREGASVRQLADTALLLSGANRSLVLLKRPEGLLRVERKPDGSYEETAFAPPDDAVLLAREPVVQKRLNRFGPLARQLAATRPASLFVGIPLRSGDPVLGVLVLLGSRPPLFLDETIATLRAMGSLVASAIETQALAIQQRHLAAIVESSDDAVLSKTLDGRIASWNQGGQRLFGYTADEAIGERGAILLAPSHESEDARLVARVLKGEGLSQYESLRRRKDGSIVPVALTISPIRDATGRVVGISEILRDITERKRVLAELTRAKEDAEAATRAKSEFLANMSHEIRTPMNAILGMASLLLDTKINAEQQEFVDTIQVSSEHLLTIINDILDFSKIESGKLELEKHAFHLGDCVEEAIEMVASKAREKRLELAYAFEREVPTWFVGDVGRIRQILVNLLSNAVKFTERGTVNVDVGVDGSSNGRFGLAFTVKDTGIGIPPDQREHLFRSFSQADASTTRRYGGTGLGLAISKQLVELMGGRIWFESTLDVGTTFHFTLRLHTAPAPAQEDDVPTRELAGARALVADDNPTNRRLLTVQGERWGLLVRATESPREALAWAESTDPFDVALLDHQMPDLDGVALGRRIRALAHRKKLPLILLSSTAYFGPQSRISDVEFTRIITKPARQSQLRDAILQAINPNLARIRPRKGQPTVTTVKGLRVLLAEDNATNQRVAIQMLRRLGVEPEIVTNGQEAVEAVRRQEFDVVLMDVHMPVMDGLEAARRLCAEIPREQRPRIVAMTAEAMHGDRERCLEAGMDDYVSKPVMMKDVERALRANAPAPAESRRKRDGAAEALFDRYVLDRYVAEMGNDPDAAREIVESFLSEARHLFDDLDMAVKSENDEDAIRAVHSIKSGAATVGAGAVAELANTLEQHGRGHRLADLREGVPELRRRWDAAAHALSDYRAELTRQR